MPAGRQEESRTWSCCDLDSSLRPDWKASGLVQNDEARGVQREDDRWVIVA